MNRNEWEQVKKIFDAALKLAPNRRKLFLDKSCGDDDSSRREVEKLREHSGSSPKPITQLGYVLAKSGNRERAQAALAELKSLAAENYVPAYDFASIYNALGEREEALNYLEKSFEEREVQMTFIKIDTRWNELRADPRFLEIIKRINLK